MTTQTLPSDLVDLNRIEAIAARLDLRQPNKEALDTVAYRVAEHFGLDRAPPPFEAVVDSATGVGKTYILAALIEYFAAEGTRNFAVVAPGRTILSKSVDNFTPNHPRSLLGGMEARPVVVTSDNFDSAAMRAVMDDPDQVKLYVFTVQALTKPQSATGRKTHAFREALGDAFYAHLQKQDDLIVFADEHHVYFGPAFSATIRDLRPRVLVGLTATPHPKTPADQIVYRYPLAAAIADRLVKTPVLVGRKDDRTDARTKLADGVRLLELKEQLIGRWCQESGATPVTPVMLVIAPKIGEANEIEAVLNDAGFAGGRYAGKVLTVHSEAPDEALAALDRLEEPANPYRVVVSVGMLKEGWDVKNVYVIASLRASVSEILTEQTLGRGLRLPFGRHTGVELLDTLEVLGHEKYEELLRRAGVLNQQFVDRRTHVLLRRTATGQAVAVPETAVVEAPVVPASADGDGAADEPGMAVGATRIASFEEHAQRAEQDLVKLKVELPRRPDLPKLRVPVLKMTVVKSEFSLADITDLDPFRKLGERIASDPAGSLRRVALRARVVTGADGLRRTELVTAQATDRVDSPAPLLPLDDLRQQLLDQVLGAPVVPARAKERRPAGQIVDAFLKGLGASADKVLSSYFDRAAAGLIQLVTEEQRRYASKPSFEQVVETVELGRTRLGRAETSQDRFGPFKKGVGYEGYKRSLYAQDWFDSAPERDMANILDDEETITAWVRLQIGDLPILWRGGREYNPDFIAVDRNGVHWVIEVKMDKARDDADVKAKRDAARRWANHVSADDQVGGASWCYLLVFEDDLQTAKGSWDALKKLGGC